MIVSPSTDRLRATWHRRVPSLHVGGWRLGALLALTVCTAVALNAIAGLLVTMHPPNVPGRGLAQGLGTNGLGGGVEAALATLDTWRTFDGLSYSADLSSAFTIATAWLLLDFVFVVLYTTSVLALTRPAGPLSGGGTANTLAATRALAVCSRRGRHRGEHAGAHRSADREYVDAPLLVAVRRRVAKMFLLIPPTLALLALLWLRRVRVLLGEPAFVRVS